MLGNYAKMVGQLEAVITPLGFVQRMDSPWSVTFDRSDGSSIVFEGDQASYPAFTLWLKPEGDDVGYALWLLIQILHTQLPEERRKPSFDNQLWFLQTREPDFWAQPEGWQARYAQQNVEF